MNSDGTSLKEMRKEGFSGNPYLFVTVRDQLFRNIFEKLEWLGETARKRDVKRLEGLVCQLTMIFESFVATEQIALVERLLNEVRNELPSSLVEVTLGELSKSINELLQDLRNLEDNWD